MKKINGAPYPTRFNPDALKESILQDRAVAEFIISHHLTREQIELSMPKFNQYRIERERFLANASQYVAKGYEPILVMNEGYADVSYKETKEHHLALEEQEVNDRIQLVNLPRSYKSIDLEHVAIDDAKRLPIVEALFEFVEHYPRVSKGLYLYGDMGIGKSFMLAAMARSLSEQKEAHITMLHFPTFAIDIRHAIQTGTVKEELDALKQAEVLILDDIGAEQATSWIRDEVLQVILQHRMLEEKPTFFTSNYSMADLENKLASGRAEGEVWEAKRVMERIRYLAREMYVEGENRR